jgi:hypothetical protein
MGVGVIVGVDVGGGVGVWVRVGAGVSEGTVTGDGATEAQETRKMEITTKDNNCAVHCFILSP